MPPNARRNSTRGSGRTAAVTAVERTLNRINYTAYSARVARNVATKSEQHDRIRARSLASTAHFVLH